MIQRIGLYAIILALVFFAGNWYGRDAVQDKIRAAEVKFKEKERVLREELTKEKAKVKEVFREHIKVVKEAVDPTQCLDAYPGDDIANLMRELQQRR